MLKNLKIPRLGRNRLGVFFVRFPSTVDAQGKRRVVQQSLRTKDHESAKLRALRFCLDLATGGDRPMSSGDPRDAVPYTVNVLTGEASADGPEDHERLMAFIAGNRDLFLTLAKLRAEAPQASPATGPAQAPAAPPGHAHAVTLEEAFRLHLAVEEKVMKDKKTVDEKRTVYRDFMAVFGATSLVLDISEHVIASSWTTVEITRPNEKFGGTLGLKRLDKRRLYLSKFFDYAKNKWHRGPNPMAARLATTGQITDDGEAYSEFTTDDLKLIFSPEYLSHMDKPDWYWIPLMGLFSGARLGELGGLEVKDFKVVDGVKVFDISTGKNKYSVRRVPIHSRLIDLGLLDYVEALRSRGATYLLHHRSADYLEKSVGLRFAIWLKRLGIKAEDEKKVFHSFRSTAITDMHNAGAGGAFIRLAVGHSTPDTDGVHGKYIRGVKLENVSKAIEKLAFPCVDFETLRLPEPTFKQFFDDWEVFLASDDYKAQVERRALHEAARKKRLEGRPLTAK